MKRALVKNAADEAQVKTAEGEENFQKKTLDEDMRIILQGKSGRRVIWSVLSDCGVFQDGFTPNAMQHSFNSGRRSIGLKLLAKVIEADQEAYFKMTREHEKGEY